MRVICKYILQEVEKGKKRKHLTIFFLFANIVILPTILFVSQNVSTAPTLTQIYRKKFRKFE